MSPGTRGYPDLHEHIEKLDAAGLLLRIDEPVNKDTEMHPLVRWQFLGGLDEADRKAFLFTNIVDGKGRKFDIPMVVGALAATADIYAVGLGVPVDGIQAIGADALANPIPPRMVNEAPGIDHIVYDVGSKPSGMIEEA